MIIHGDMTGSRNSSDMRKQSQNTGQKYQTILMQAYVILIKKLLGFSKEIYVGKWMIYL